MKEYASKFYKSNAWKQCRENYLKSVGGLCEQCLKKGLFVPAVIVHHKNHITEHNINNPDITLNYFNLEALCRDCHKQEHPEFGGKKTQRRYFVDENGRVISIHDDDFDSMTPPVND